MADARNMATGGAHEAQRQTRENDAALLPPVDIFEDTAGITLLADLPGVSKERLNMQVERDKLIIEGEAQIELPDAMEPLYADVRSTHYRRSFTLSNELETDGIEATLKDGVLSVRIPKREEVRPRKIEVRTS